MWLRPHKGERIPIRDGGKGLNARGLLQRNMNPSPFIDQLRVRQVVSDVRQPARVHRYVSSSTFRVVAVRCTTHGLVEGLTAEA